MSSVYSIIDVKFGYFSVSIPSWRVYYFVHPLSIHGDSDMCDTEAFFSNQLMSALVNSKGQNEKNKKTKVDQHAN